MSKTTANLMGGATFIYMVGLWSQMLWPSWATLHYMSLFGSIVIALLVASLPVSILAAIFGNRAWWLLSASVLVTWIIVAIHIDI
jgi:hypothetical protein